MTSTCIECGIDFEGTARKNARKFCTERCRERSKYRKRSIAAGTYTGKRFPPRGDRCLHCGGSMDGRTPQARYCSDRCRYDARLVNYHAHKHDDKDLSECAFTYCEALFLSIKSSRYCSATCKYAASEQAKHGDGAAQSNAIRRGLLDACRVYFCQCVDCGDIACTRTRRKSQVVCKQCRRRRNQRRDAFKSHRRRGAKPDRPISVHDIAQRDGTRCHICRKTVDMSLSGLDKWGPTIEHIICISWDADAAKDISQHVLAHRHCNLSRNNKKPSQMVLPLGA